MPTTEQRGHLDWARVFEYDKLQIWGIVMFNLPQTSRQVQSLSFAQTHTQTHTRGGSHHPHLKPPGSWLRPARQAGRRKGCRGSLRGTAAISAPLEGSGSPVAAAWSAGPCRPLWAPSAWSQLSKTPATRGLRSLWWARTEGWPPWLLQEGQKG